MRYLFAILALTLSVYAAGLKDIKHVVLFMQENRAFDHYFGTMAGVRGFKDPNVHISKNTGKSVFHQPVDKSILFGGPPLGVNELKPFYLNHKGGDWHERTQCMLAGTNKWEPNHLAWHDGSMDKWALKNSPYSVGYFKQEDLPVQFTLADNFVVGDAYHEGIISGTNPNRAIWLTGTMNPNGDPREVGGPFVENSNAPHCGKSDRGDPINCMPLRWKTVPEYLDEAGISWQVYQDNNSYVDNPLIFWKQYQNIPKNSSLSEHALRLLGLEKFLDDARNGNLPEVSYVVAHQYLTEHPPFTLQDGAWMQRQVADALMHGKDWDSTVLIVSYDETGGWADHVMAPHAPKGTNREWMVDPFDSSLGEQPVGPGFRVPFYIVSPFTRRGGVFTEVSSHESQILFLEEWAKAHGKPFHTKDMNPWRRKYLSNLVNAFDFSNPDYSVPSLPGTREPSKDIHGQYNGAIVCLARFLGLILPPIPYGEESQKKPIPVEKGDKRVRGGLTEGRYLVFEKDGMALQHGHKLGATKINKHDTKQQFVIKWKGDNPLDYRFLISDGSQYLTHNLTFSDDGALFSISYDRSSGGYDVVDTRTHEHLVLRNGTVSFSANKMPFIVYSVTQ